jgi:diguanylate cyclase (GGDEF)-like protein/PAS domain S-box-containing protein
MDSAPNVGELAVEERRLRAIFERSPAPTMIVDARSGALLDANRAAWELFGHESLRSLQAAQPNLWLAGEHNAEQATQHLREAVTSGGVRLEWPCRHRGGDIVWCDATLMPMELDGRLCVLAVCLDITHRRQSDDRLRESERRFRRVLQDIDGVSVQGYGADGRVHYWNRASEQLYGYTAEEAMQSNLLDLIIPPEMRDAVRENLNGVSHGRDIENGELELMRKDGSRVLVYSSHTVLRRPGEPPELFCIDIDLSERQAHEAALDRMANYDALTGLPNRRLMALLLEQLIARTQRSERGFALCYLDLDEFKPINDVHGHETGDRVLVTVGERLRRLVRGSDLVSRLGGDEFVIALDGVGEGPELERRLRFILDGLSQPLHIDELVLRVYGSIGVTLDPQDGGDPDTLLRHADQAMYRAKAQGRNRFSVFDTSIGAKISEQRRRLKEIEAGLERLDFVLHYQPKIELQSGQVVGFEGLVRWQHPQAGLLPPLEFLPILESTELEAVFGEYVLKQALQQLEIWLAAGLDIDLSVNISGPHLLSQGFADRLEALLSRHPSVPPRRLELEILESAAVSDLERAVQVLETLRGLGLRTSLDDFGTGYSSLSHLRTLPVDEVKIDQSFVRDMLSDINDYNIVRSVIGLAEAFGLRAVAEGVESEAHASALHALGCHLAQGYAFARPMPAGQVAEWLSIRRQARRTQPPAPTGG